MQLRVRFLAALGVLFICGIGCSPGPVDESAADPGLADTAGSEEADAVDGKKQDFGSAIAELEELSTTILAAFEQETPEEAHDALHEVGHLLEDVSALAAQEQASETASMESVNEHVEALFDAFGSLDDTLHGGEDVELPEIKKQIETNLKSLKELVP